jgi:hypothetical protein
MDQLSQDLSSFLMRMHLQPGSVNERIEHFMKHLIYLLPDEDVRLVSAFYGINDCQLTSVAALAEKNGCTVLELQQRIEQDIRRLAVTPEWQMIKQLI